MFGAAARGRVDALHHRDQPALGMSAVEEVEIRPRPALPRREERPAAIGRGRDDDDVFLRTALAENDLVVRRIVTEPVKRGAGVVVLVAGRDRAGRRMERVVEAIVGPGDARALGVRDQVHEIAPRDRFEHVQRRELVAAAGQAIRDVSRVGRRVVPVERDQPRRIHRVRIHEHAVRSTR